MYYEEEDKTTREHNSNESEQLALSFGLQRQSQRDEGDTTAAATIDEMYSASRLPPSSQD
jgi:hypothetical protein